MYKKCHYLLVDKPSIFFNLCIRYFLLLQMTVQSAICGMHQLYLRYLSLLGCQDDIPRHVNRYYYYDHFYLFILRK